MPAPPSCTLLREPSSPNERELEQEERVRQETREQIPHLAKMKQALNAMSVSFARMASEAVLAGWDPEFEQSLIALQEKIEEAQANEKELGAIDGAAERDTTPDRASNPGRWMDEIAAPTPSSSAPSTMDLNAHRPPSALAVEGATCPADAAPSTRPTEEAGKEQPNTDVCVLQIAKADV